MSVSTLPTKREREDQKVTMSHLLSTAKGCPNWVDMRLRPIAWLPMEKKS